jgi:hypothetical protein
MSIDRYQLLMERLWKRSLDRTTLQNAAMYFEMLSTPPIYDVETLDSGLPIHSVVR